MGRQAVRHIEDGNLQAAAAELRSLLSHTADALDDVVPMRAAAMLVEVYLRQGSTMAASGAPVCLHSCGFLQLEQQQLLLLQQVAARLPISASRPSPETSR